MSTASSTSQPVSSDYWRRFLARTVAPHSERDARRAVRRYPFAMPGQLLFTQGDRERREDFAIIQVSVVGMMGVIREEIPWHEKVSIEINPEGTPLLLWGRARHCTATIGGYKLGIELRFADKTAGPNARKSQRSDGAEPEA